LRAARARHSTLATRAALSLLSFGTTLRRIAARLPGVEIALQPSEASIERQLPNVRFTLKSEKQIKFL
jgi:hypothetical protein